MPTLEALAQSTGPRNGRPRPRAGVISTNNPTIICAVDGIADVVNVKVEGSVGTSNWYVTDEAGIVLLKQRGGSTFSTDFEGAGVGICFIYHGANRGGFRNVSVGGNIGSVIGRIRFSPRIQITRRSDCDGPIDPQPTPGTPEGPLEAKSMTVSGKVFVTAIGGDSSRVLEVAFFSSQTGGGLGISETRIITSADGSEVSAEISTRGLYRTLNPRVIVRVRDADNGRTFDRRVLHVPDLLP